MIKLLSSLPFGSLVLNLSGLLCFYVGQRELALKLIRQSVVRKARQPAIYSNSGQVFYASRYFTEAATAFTQAIALGNRSANSYEQVINALEATGDHGTALKFILEKERLHPSGLPYTRGFPVMNKYDVGQFTYGIPIVKDWHHGATLKIGDFCSIAENVTILLGGNHSIDWISSFPFGVIFDEVKDKSYLHPTKSKGDVIIGNDVWLGMNATILSGITIGDGAVVAACAVVTKNVLPYTIVGGNPAKPLKKRFTDEEIVKLLEIQWWNWEIAKIQQNIQMITSQNISEFLNEHHHPASNT
jgi:acetyltransferase-like isoleucine patch superfamily enzyme